jgi:hypothetical protein
MIPHDLLPGDFRLPREEYVFLFYRGHNIGMSLHFLMMNASAHEICLTHFNQVRIRALKADYCVPWRHRANRLLLCRFNPACAAEANALIRWITNRETVAERGRQIEM